MAEDLFGLAGLDPDHIDRLAEQLPDVSDQWPRTLAELVDVLAAGLKRRGRDDATAEQDARFAVLTIARYRGGRQFYLPAGDDLDRALRDTEIYQRWSRGENIHDLARASDVSETRIYQIIAAQRRLRFRRQQRVLPFDAA